MKDLRFGDTGLTISTASHRTIGAPGEESRSLGVCARLCGCRMTCYVRWRQVALSDRTLSLCFVARIHHLKTTRHMEMDSDRQLRMLKLKLEYYESLCREQTAKIVDLEVQVRYLQEHLAGNPAWPASHAISSPIAQDDMHVCFSSYLVCSLIFSHRLWPL